MLKLQVHKMETFIHVLIFVWPCIIEYNDVNNQQDAKTLSFINLFSSAPHVSGDKFVHPQERFLTVYTTFATMHRHCCRSVSRLRWNVSSTSTVAPVGSSVGALYQKLYISSKCSWGWANLSPEICRAELKRLINDKVVASCWLFTSYLYTLSPRID